MNLQTVFGYQFSIAYRDITDMYFTAQRSTHSCRDMTRKVFK